MPIEAHGGTHGAAACESMYGFFSTASTDRFAKTYTSGATPPVPPRRRGFVSRVLTYATVGAAVFYGGSVFAAKQNETYRDFFTERVFGGNELVTYFDKHELRDIPEDLRHMDVEARVAQAANHVRDGFHRMSNYVRQNEHVQHTREEVEKRTAELQDKLQEQLGELRDKAERESAHLYEQAQAMAGRSLSDAREQVDHLAERFTHAGDKAREEVSDAVSGASDAASDAVTKVAPASVESGNGHRDHDAPSAGVYGAPYAERKLVASGDNGGRLRPDPEAPRLPQLTSSLKKLGSSEPVIAQLAGTIDELAAFLKESPHASTLARGVLETAEADFQSLCKRLDQIKAKDAEKLDAQLENQARAFEAELKKAADKASSELGQRDQDWAKRVSALQDEQARQFKTHLAKELETQSAIIDQRLKEEVIARGIELQRKWSNEIKAKVEQERAGRLARLDELAQELQGIEGMLFENADTLDDSFSLNSLHAALRALRSTIDAHAAEDSPYVRRTFVNELATLSATPKAKNNDLIAEALKAVDATGTASDGIESVPTLHEWFTVRVAPRLTQVALLPEQGAGVLSYVASMVMSPLLFTRKGNVPGNDVSSIIARAEWFLERRDLDAATRELNQLRGWAKILVSDWLQAARKRLEVDQALDLVQQEASFASLLRT